MSAEQVRARFRDAVKRGNPRWLWPEVAQDRWRAATVAIERITRDVLLEGHSKVRLAGDETAVGVAAFTSGMGPLLGHWLAEKRFDADDGVSRVLACHLAHNSMRMARLHLRAIEVVQALARRGVPVTVLKGMHTAFAYFPRPGTRPVSDIDLLISPAHEPVAARVLESLNFRPSGSSVFPERTWRKAGVPFEPKSVYFTHENDQWSVDLHVTLDLRATSVARLRLDGLGPEMRDPWPLSSAGSCLGSPLLPLHLAMHAGAHLLSLTMIRLTELVLVLRAEDASGRLCWDALLALAQRERIAGSAYPALRLCEDLAPGTVPEDVLLACRRSLPAKTLRILDPLRPASACPVTRCSFEERTMWLPGVAAMARQIARDLAPFRRPLVETLAFYRVVLWKLFRRTVTW